MRRLRLKMVGNNATEMTWPRRLNRALNDHQTYEQFGFRLLIQLKANFRMAGYLANLLPYHKGEHELLSAHRERMALLHRLEDQWKQFACLSAPSLFFQPSSSDVKCAVGWSKHSWDKKRKECFSSLLQAILLSWADLPGSPGNVCARTDAWREVWYYQGRLQLRLCSPQEPEAWWGEERRYLSFHSRKALSFEFSKAKKVVINKNYSQACSSNVCIIYKLHLMVSML